MQTMMHGRRLGLRTPNRGTVCLVAWRFAAAPPPLPRNRPTCTRVQRQVAFIREFTIPENYRYQTEEYASVAADPARGLVYVGSRDGTLVAIDDRLGEVMWEIDLGGGISSVPLLAIVDESAALPEGDVTLNQPLACRAST